MSASAAEALANRLSVQVGESDFSVACIASPICDVAGVCHATMSIVVPANKVAQTELDLANRVRRSAEQVEIRLGWRQPVWAAG